MNLHVMSLHVAMNPQYTPAIFGLVGVIVGLIGNMIAQFFLHRWQRKQWILDCKKAEWRELIGTLVESERGIWENSPHFAYDFEPSKEEAEEHGRRFSEADSKARRTIEDRIFISRYIKKEDVLERWQLIAGEENLSRTRELWQDLHASLVQAAHRDLDLHK